MLEIPYVAQPDSKSCALASYTMVARRFFPEVTFGQIAQISDWQRGYVVWAFKFWLWILNKGISITEYDTLDYEAWAKEGVEGLKKSVSEKEFDYYVNNTKDLGSYSTDIKNVLKHPNFNSVSQKPNFGILENAVKEGKACEVVLDSRSLRDKEGFSLHRVVILNLENNEVKFHDPAAGPNQSTPEEKFSHSWLEVVSEPELCIYSS